MSKGKLAKFADMETYENVFQYPYSVVEHVPFAMQGHWHEQYFKNQNPIVLELGCGKGEYAVELAKAHPDQNYIGVDIKGARMWTGATRALQEGIKNVAFLRTNIEIIDRFFAPDEVQEIWLTFSDPQMKNPRKRLTSTYFMERYRRFLTDRGIIHLKTDSNFLFTYTRYMVERNQLPVEVMTEDLYSGEWRVESGECKVDSVECRVESGEFATAVPAAQPTSAVASSTLSTLNPQPSTLNSQPSTLNSQLSTLNPQPSTLNSQPSTLNPQLSTLNSQLKEAASIQTYYEQMWLSRGLNIRYMKFLLPREGQLEEPDVEIELDDYRSYHRSKRSPLETRR